MCIRDRVNPVIHTIYATSAENSTFATINCSISAQGIEFPQTTSSNNKGQGSGR